MCKIELDINRPDMLNDPLVLRVTRLFAGPLGWLYKFNAHSGQRRLACGRLSAMIPAIAGHSPVAAYGTKRSVAKGGFQPEANVGRLNF